VIFSEDSPLGRFADSDYELADRDYGLDLWALLPSHVANEIIENTVHGNSPMQAGTAAIAAIKAYMREHIKLLEQTAKLFAEAAAFRLSPFQQRSRAGRVLAARSACFIGAAGRTGSARRLGGGRPADGRADRGA